MLYFVGVGPGDPELITMKAVRILQEAAVILLPDSGRDSVIWKIIEKWVKNKPVYSVSIPMHGMKQEWHEAHRRAAEHIRELMKEYETAAYPVLGDPGIYASGSYLMKHISAHHPCNVIPGVPAMCVAAAELGIPLCEQHEDLWVTDQEEYNARYSSLDERYRQQTERYDQLEAEKQRRLRLRDDLKRFIDTLKHSDIISDFYPDTWYALAECITVYAKEDIRVTFRNGTTI